MNKQQLQQEIEALQKQLEEKQKALAAMPDKWEPEGGEYWVNVEGRVLEGISAENARNYGVEYPTREQAEKAAKAMRAHNRLLAYVAEFAQYHSGTESSYVARRECDGVWEHIMNATRSKGVMVYMPHTMAKELADKLNSGEVEL